MKTPFLRLSALLVASSLLLVLSVLALSGEVDDILPSIVAENSDPVKSPDDDFTVILDAGHGGEDGGASGLHGALEKDLNLSVVLLTKRLLEECGVRVLLTREDDRMLGSGSTGHKKLEDLRARLDYANAHNEAVLISVHMNKFPLEYCRGVQLFYSPNNERSILLAERLHACVKDFFQKDNVREIKKAGGAIYLLDRVKIPAALIECGFLSNEEESLLLQSAEYQKKLAALIVSSVLSYRNEIKTTT